MSPIIIVRPHTHGAAGLASAQGVASLPPRVASPAGMRLTAWLCLLLYVFVGIAPRSRLVLCIEEDGQMAVELHATGTVCCDHACCPLDSGHHEPTAGCDCIDIPLLAQRDDSSPQHPQEHLVPIDGDSPPCLIGFTPSCAPGCRGSLLCSRRPPPRTGLLETRRSVVLLL